MGEVQLCADHRIGRQVAMKVIRGGQAETEEVRARFLREARVQAQLEHPAIVPVYDLGFNDEGQVYFTMKRIRGRTLDSVVDALREGDPDPSLARRRLLTAFAQVCLAVDFAHQRGVLHRDLKPANLMIGEYGEVYVLDWGLAKISAHPSDDPEVDLEGLAEGDSHDTDPRRLLGTPGYIAPEQLEGNSSPRSDVYALGAILFELLTHEFLNLGEAPLVRIGSTIDGPDARASVRRPDLDIPPELDQLCQRATATAVSERFASARELHDALERVLDGDRNVELRKQYAERAAEEAQTLADAAIAGDDASRAPAMRAIARTLGLDPGHKGALSHLAKLLASPPTHLPPEAARALDDTQDEQARLESRHGALGFVSFVIYVPLVLWMGLRDATWLTIATTCMLASAAVLYYTSRQPAPRRRQWFTAAVGTLALVSLYRLFGAFVFLPTIIVGHVVSYATSPDPKLRWGAVGMGILGLCAAAAADWWGLFARQSEAIAGALTINPGIASFPDGPTQLVLLLASIGLVSTPVVIIGRTRDALTRARRRIETQAWHFRQMLDS